MAGASALGVPTFLHAQDQFTASPTVATAGGKVSGTMVEGVAAYLGLPYGAPPVGRLRFMPPRKPAPWSGVRDGARWPAIAIQTLTSGFEGMAPTGEGQTPPVTHMPRNAADRVRLAQSEDCLTLDVWTAGANTRAKKPVMVWLHGGGFALGSGSGTGYAGANLVKRGDVVLVNVNHRL